MLAGNSAIEVAPHESVVRNLNGQKLGRKGRDTRARIVACATELVEQGGDTPLTLSAVARKSGLGLTSLYLYFTDLTELLLAVLEPVIEAEVSYLHLIRAHWPDESLTEHCRAFAASYYAYWQKNSRILHLRSSLADQNELRMLHSRVDSARKVIEPLSVQMNANVLEPDTPEVAFAVMLAMGLERAVSVRTDIKLPDLLIEQIMLSPDRFLDPAARMLELGIRDARSKA